MTMNNQACCAICWSSPRPGKYVSFDRVEDAPAFLAWQPQAA